MKSTIKTAIGIIAAFVLLSAFGHSQLRIVPVVTGNRAACNKILMTVQQQYLRSFDHPTKWTVVIACDEEAWRQIQSRAFSTQGVTDYAFSDIATNYSYFNGPLLMTDEIVARRNPEFVMAHEAAHILTKCKADRAGEKLADAVAYRLMDHKPFGDLYH